MKPFEQLADNECHWPVDELWCADPVKPNPYHPYCAQHLERSRPKRRQHLEMVEILNSPPPEDINKINDLSVSNKKGQSVRRAPYSSNEAWRSAKGTEASVRSKKKSPGGPVKSAYDFMAHAGGE